MNLARAVRISGDGGHEGRHLPSPPQKKLRGEVAERSARGKQWPVAPRAKQRPLALRGPPERGDHSRAQRKQVLGAVVQNVCSTTARSAPVACQKQLRNPAVACMRFAFLACVRWLPGNRLCGQAAGSTALAAVARAESWEVASVSVEGSDGERY